MESERNRAGVVRATTVGALRGLKGRGQAWVGHLVVGGGIGKRGCFVGPFYVRGKEKSGKARWGDGSGSPLV